MTTPKYTLIGEVPCCRFYVDGVEVPFIGCGAFKAVFGFPDQEVVYKAAWWSGVIERDANLLREASAAGYPVAEPIDLHLSKTYGVSFFTQRRLDHVPLDPSGDREMFKKWNQRMLKVRPPYRFTDIRLANMGVMDGEIVVHDLAPWDGSPRRFFALRNGEIRLLGLRDPAMVQLLPE